MLAVICPGHAVFCLKIRKRTDLLCSGVERKTNTELRPFFSDGTNIWRDGQRPTEILDQLCKRRGIPEPVYHDSRRCQVAGQQYFLTADGKLEPFLHNHILSLTFPAVFLFVL